MHTIACAVVAIKLRKIGVLEALVVVVHRAHHARPRTLNDNEPLTLPVNLIALYVYVVCVCVRIYACQRTLDDIEPYTLAVNLIALGVDEKFGYLKP